MPCACGHAPRSHSWGVGDCHVRIKSKRCDCKKFVAADTIGLLETKPVEVPPTDNARTIEEILRGMRRDGAPRHLLTTPFYCPCHTVLS